MQNLEIHGATVARTSFQTTGAAGLELEEFLGYARGQFAKRFARIEKARSVGVAAVGFEEEDEEEGD